MLRLKPLHGHNFNSFCPPPFSPTSSSLSHTQTIRYYLRKKRIKIQCPTMLSYILSIHASNIRKPAKVGEEQACLCYPTTHAVASHNRSFLSRFSKLEQGWCVWNDENAQSSPVQCGRCRSRSDWSYLQVCVYHSSWLACCGCELRAGRKLMSMICLFSLITQHPHQPGQPRQDAGGNAGILYRQWCQRSEEVTANRGPAT